MSGKLCSKFVKHSCLLFVQLAGKETFVTDASTVDILKTSDPNHPFPERKLLRRKRKAGKSVSFVDRNTSGPLSPQSTSSSTLTGQESESRMFSDSEDGSVNTYRIKSMMRGKAPVVYVYGEMNEQITDKKCDESILQKQTTDLKSDSCKLEDKEDIKGIKTENDTENKNDVVTSDEPTIKKESTKEEPITPDNNESLTTIKSEPFDSNDVEMASENIVIKQEQSTENEENEKCTTSSINESHDSESQCDHESNDVNARKTQEDEQKVISNNETKTTADNEKIKSENTTHNEEASENNKHDQKGLK